MLDNNKTFSSHLSLSQDEPMWEEPFLSGDVLTDRIISGIVKA